MNLIHRRSFIVELSSDVNYRLCDLRRLQTRLIPDSRKKRTFP